MAFERISVDHRIMGGVPCLRGSRIPVARVVGMVADGMTTEEILADFPQLSAEDIQDALRYAALAVDERELPLRSTPWGSVSTSPSRRALVLCFATPATTPSMSETGACSARKTIGSWRPQRPEAQVRLLLANLEAAESELARRAVLALTPGRARLRALPIEPQS